MDEEKSSGHAPLDAPPPVSEDEGIRKDLSAFETVSADVQRKNLAATRVIATVTALYMGFAALQWWTMRNQLAEMHGTGVQTDKLIAAAKAISDHQKQMVDDNKTNLGQNKTAIENTLKENRYELAKLLGENQKALKASLAQGKVALDASIKAMRLDQRAWVGAVAGKPFHVSVKLRNSGKTPAQNLTSRLSMLGFPTSEGEPKAFPSTRLLGRASNFVMPPDGTYDLPWTFYDRDNKEYVFTDTEVAFYQPKPAALTMYLWGRVEYDDTFRCHHWMKFCAAYEPVDNRFQPCAHGNEVDDDSCDSARN